MQSAFQHRLGPCRLTLALVADHCMLPTDCWFRCAVSPCYTTNDQCVAGCRAAAGCTHTPQHPRSCAFRPFQRNARSQGHAHTEQVQRVHATTPCWLHVSSGINVDCLPLDCLTSVVRLADDARRCGQAPCPLVHQRSRMHARPRCQVSASGAGASDASMPPARPPELEQCVASIAALQHP